MNKYKRLSAVLLAAACLLCLAGCTDNPVSTESRPDGGTSLVGSAGIGSAASVTENPTDPVYSTEAPPSVISRPEAQSAESGITAPAQSQPSPSGTTKPPAVSSQPEKPPVVSSQPTKPPTASPDPQPAQPGGIPNKVTVTAPGTLVKRSDSAVIDYSNSKDGYVMVRFTKQTDKRLKVQLKGPKITYTYNLTPDQWTAFPFSDENGSYKITVLQNTTGSKYATLLSLTVNVTMENEFAPFLHSNQYVDFDAAPNAVAKAAQLTNGITDPLKRVEKVYDFVVKSLTYDRELAATVQSGYLPKLDQVLVKKKGICFDYAALMTGMLRSLGIPTKLVVGYAGEAYHAWISVWSEKDGWVDGVIYFDGTSWKRMDPTYASSGGSSSDIMNYIGDGSNYAPKYFY